jgi:hypothetical protein
VINVYDFPHGARGLRVAWLCEEMGLAHTFVPVDFPPGSNYNELNISVVTALRIWGRGVGQELPTTLQVYCERLQERPACKLAMAAHVQGGGEQ